MGFGLNAFGLNALGLIVLFFRVSDVLRSFDFFLGSLLLKKLSLDYRVENLSLEIGLVIHLEDFSSL